MKSKWPEPGWERFRNDDHRALLKKIVATKASVDVVYQLCSPWLHLIVEELHFGSQKTSALTLLPGEVTRITKEYLFWLKEEGLWQDLLAHWRLPDIAGPWSLPLFLATAYRDFLQSQYPDLSVKESSLSYKRAIVEYSTRTNHRSSRVVGLMAEQIVESFEAWTNTLPEELRMAYQMHLEGMLENEIAAILNMAPDEIHQKINAAKAILGVGQSEAI